jgi:integral membrane sensor domain MASE1
MNRTPRYIRLVLLAVSVSALLTAHATMRELSLALGDSPNLLEPLIQLSYLVVCLAFVCLLNLAWVFTEQKVK